MKKILMILGLALLLSGCGGNDPTLILFRVTFVSHGDEVLGTVDVPEGHTINRPVADPVRDDWTFINWFDSAAGGELFDFETRITRHTFIWARWTQTPATVTFNLAGGTWRLSGNTSVINQGDPVRMPPEDPVRTGYLFAGWFDDPFGGNVWDFETPINDDITIWARWALPVRVTFDLTGGTWTHPSYIDIPQGSALAAVDLPTPVKNVMAGFQGLFRVPAGGWNWAFENWQFQGSEWLPTAAVQGNMTLSAHWTSPYGPMDIPDREPFSGSTNFIHRAFSFAAENLGDYYLMLNEDITVPPIWNIGLGAEHPVGEVLVQGSVTLIGLNEMRTIFRPRSAPGLLFAVLGGELIIGENITLSGDRYYPSNAGLVLVNDARMTMLEGSRITQHRQTGAGIGLGAPVILRNNSTFTMRGGEITGNGGNAGTNNAGGVLVTNSTFNMEGGKIFDNVITTSGSDSAGGVRLQTVTGGNATFNMSGGKIFNNSVTNTASSNSSGGVSVSSGSVFHMTGGEIFNNSVAGSSGGGGVRAAGPFNMTNGRIFGNRATAANSGGGVTVVGTTFNMHSGEISGNTAVGNTSGGGVFLNNGGHFNMRGGVISANLAEGTNSGGGVRLTHANDWFRLSNGILHGSNAPEELRNIAAQRFANPVDIVSAHVLRFAAGNAQRGTWNGTVWQQMLPQPWFSGGAGVVNTTIHAVNGNLQ